MTDQQDRPDGEGQQAETEQVVKYLRWVFRQYREEMSLSVEDGIGVDCSEFCVWLVKRMDLVSLNDRDNECDDVGIDVQTWEFVKTTLDLGTALSHFGPIWPAIIFGDRENPKHALDRVTSVILFTFKDGTILPSSTTMAAELTIEGMFTDASVGIMLQNNLQQQVSKLMESGIDKLHDLGGNYRGTTPEDPFEVMMGLLLKHCIPNIRPELQRIVLDYTRLFQGIVRPVFSPEAKAAFAKEKAAYLADKARKEGKAPPEDPKERKERPRGGWSG